MWFIPWFSLALNPFECFSAGPCAVDGRFRISLRTSASAAIAQWRGCANYSSWIFSCWFSRACSELGKVTGATTVGGKNSFVFPITIMSSGSPWRWGHYFHTLSNSYSCAIITCSRICDTHRIIFSFSGGQKMHQFQRLVAIFAYTTVALANRGKLHFFVFFY